MYKPDKPRISSVIEAATADTLHDNPIWYAIDRLIPMHRLSLVVAQSGDGLTHFACQLAATLAPLPATPDTPDTPSLPALTTDETPDETTPDEPQPTVLLITPRDQPDVIKHHLRSLNVDLASVLVVSSVTEIHEMPGHSPEYTRPFRPTDHHNLYQLLRQYKAVRMVVIDNAELMFSNTNRPSRLQLQRQLALLASVAVKREVGIVMLTSIPALRDNPFNSNLLASLREAARRVFLLAPTIPNAIPSANADPTPNANPTQRLLFCLKDTLATEPLPTLTLNFAQPVALPTEPQQTRDLTYPHYLALLRNPKTRGPAPHQHDYACEVLLELLKSGPLRVGQLHHPTSNTLTHHAKTAAIAWRTLCRAKQTLQITAYRHKKHWYWKLPDTIPTQPQTETATAAQSPAPTPPPPHPVITLETRHSSPKTAPNSLSHQDIPPAPPLILLPGILTPNAIATPSSNPTPSTPAPTQPPQGAPDDQPQLQS